MKTTPRQTFRKRHKDDADKLATIISEPWFERAVSFALAEMSSAGKHLSIPGAGDFINTLESLAQDDVPVNKPPGPSLPSYGI